MKKFALIGLLLGVVVAGMAAYYLAVVKPDGDIAEEQLFTMHDASWFGGAEHLAILSRLDLRTDFAIYTLFAGGLALLINIWPAIKREKLAWAGLALSFCALFVGLAFGTHMFS